MSYIVDFCVASFLYLSITVFFYFRQRRVSNLRNSLYGYLLIIGLLTLFFDCAAGLMDPYSRQVPRWLYYGVNICFLLATQSSPPVFLLYSLVLTGYYPKLNRLQRFLLLIPFLLVCFLLLISPFTNRGIFYLGPDGFYTHGATHITLYIAAAFYLVSGMVCVVLSRHLIQRKKRFTIFAFVFITLVAMVIQSLYPALLINTTAMAISLSMMYYVLQLPSEHIDPATGLLNRTAMAELLHDMFEQNQKFGVLLFQMVSIHGINQTFGVKAGAYVQRGMADYLQQKFPNNYVFRNSNSSYCVLTEESLIQMEDLKWIQSGIPKVWKDGSTNIPFSSWLIGIRSREFSGLGDLLENIDYLMSRPANEPDSVLLADHDFILKRKQEENYHAAVRRAVVNKSVEVYYQPVENEDGTIVSYEALARINDEDFGLVMPDQFIPIAEKDGLISELGKQVLCNVCAFLRDELLPSGFDKFISINLSTIELIQHDLADDIHHIVTEYQMMPALLSFEIRETEAGASIQQISENLQQLRNLGYGLIVDDFGAGFTDFSYLTRQTFSYVKIDKKLVWEAAESSRKLTLLKGMMSILTDLGIETICEGVETQQQAACLRSIGAKTQQGFLYAEPLPSCALLLHK